jgi:hypothetical protein
MFVRCVLGGRLLKFADCLLLKEEAAAAGAGQLMTRSSGKVSTYGFSRRVENSTRPDGMKSSLYPSLEELIIGKRKIIQ